MNDTKNINDYVSTYIHKGKEKIFSVLDITTDIMDDKRSPMIKETFIDYFNKKEYKQSGATKHALDVSKVEYINSSGLSAIIILNRLSFNNGDGYISLIGCGEALERLISILNLDQMFNCKDKVEDL